ncbi:hypothetical protein D3C79_774310 [compost metagenome]
MAFSAETKVLRSSSFRTNAEAPPSRQRRANSSGGWPVSTRMRGGTGSSPCRRLNTLRPSMPGRPMSRITTSGRSSRASCQAISPSCASPTTVKSARSSNRRTAKRTVEWSSTINTVVNVLLLVEYVSKFPNHSGGRLWLRPEGRQRYVESGNDSTRRRSVLSLSATFEGNSYG